MGSTITGHGKLLGALIPFISLAWQLHLHTTYQPPSPIQATPNYADEYELVVFIELKAQSREIFV